MWEYFTSFLPGFGFEKKTNINIENNMQSVSNKTDIKSTMFVMEVSVEGNEVAPISVSFDDSPSRLAQAFVVEHKLEEDQIPVITKHIESIKRKFFPNSRRNSEVSEMMDGHQSFVFGNHKTNLTVSNTSDIHKDSDLSRRTIRKRKRGMDGDRLRTNQGSDNTITKESPVISESVSTSYSSSSEFNRVNKVDILTDINHSFKMDTNNTSTPIQSTSMMNKQMTNEEDDRSSANLDARPSVSTSSRMVVVSEDDSTSNSSSSSSSSSSNSNSKDSRSDDFSLLPPSDHIVESQSNIDNHPPNHHKNAVRSPVDEFWDITPARKNEDSQVIQTFFKHHPSQKQSKSNNNHVHYMPSVHQTLSADCRKAHSSTNQASSPIALRRKRIGPPKLMTTQRSIQRKQREEFRQQQIEQMNRNQRRKKLARPMSARMTNEVRNQDKLNQLRRNNLIRPQSGRPSCRKTRKMTMVLNDNNQQHLMNNDESSMQCQRKTMVRSPLEVNQTFSRLFNQAREKEEKQEMIRRGVLEQRKQQEIQECSFKPQISQSARTIRRNGSKVWKRIIDPLGEEKRKRQDRMMELKRTNNKLKHQKECPFQPQKLTNFSHHLCSSPMNRMKMASMMIENGTDGDDMTAQPVWIRLNNLQSKPKGKSTMNNNHNTDDDDDYGRTAEERRIHQLRKKKQRQRKEEKAPVKVRYKDDEESASVLASSKFKRTSSMMSDELKKKKNNSIKKNQPSLLMDQSKPKQKKNNHHRSHHHKKRKRKRRSARNHRSTNIMNQKSLKHQNHNKLTYSVDLSMDERVFVFEGHT